MTRGSQAAGLSVAAALLLLVVVAARGESPVPSNIVDPTLERGVSGVPMHAPSHPSLGMPFDVTGDAELVGRIITAIVIALFVLALVLSVLSARRNRHRVGVGVVADPVEGVVDSVLRLRLREAVAEARDTLARPGGVARDAVIQAWVTLETATAHTRAPHQTATEFTVALLERESTDEDALRELRTLYQRARFGHRSAERDAERARDALGRILATLR
jgi:hypothetical protein